ncbi:uncharacterized protein LOC141632565 [Silene latifolia]|uniref:uncharacterized protein LOC141632565 n=1 Tax=Silene latifolia TaxID=37657 RepID=UPI003D787377
MAKRQQKKCEFHRDIGHTTEDCYTLRREIRRLYEQGEPSHLLPRGGKQQDKVGFVKPATPPTCTKIINVIIGGSDLSGLTYSAAKRRAIETKGDRPYTSCRVSHSDSPAVALGEEYVHDSQEHLDALIITLSMANCTVRMVLIDTGSSVNIIMLKTIENTGFSEKDLQKKTIPLVGFSGETTNSLGEIVIPTYAGGINKQRVTDPGVPILDSLYINKSLVTLLDLIRSYSRIYEEWLHNFLNPTDLFPSPTNPSTRTVTKIAGVTGIDPSIITHKLSVDLGCKPIQQRRRKFAAERNKVINQEVDSLLTANKIRENAGSTYQRLVNRMFKEQIGKTMEVYIEDMVVKLEKAKDHMQHLAGTLSTLREYKMKLNPSKCTFGVSSGKFLGYIVTQRGIEVSTEQIKGVLHLESPEKPKYIQRLAGKVAALSRFISRSSDRCRLFYDILRKS